MRKELLEEDCLKHKEELTKRRGRSIPSGELCMKASSEREYSTFTEWKEFSMAGT